jgi:DNA-directed RNA polymerase subunit RPC12/RpoP
VIKFHCKNCGQNISVKDKLAGKRGKCPKCGYIVVVPDTPAKIEFPCKGCGQKIAVPKSYAGKKGRCPNCKSIVFVPGHATASPKSIKTVCFVCSMCNGKIEVPEASRGKLIECPKCGSFVEVPSQRLVPDEARMPIPESALERLPNRSPEQPAAPVAETAEEQTGPIGKRKLPWPIDIMLYPTSAPGLLTIAVIIGGQFVARFLSLCCLGWILQIIMALYMYWYFCECIRDSAAGGVRAPETIGGMAAFGEMFWQYLRLFACYAFFFGPVTFYNAYVLSSDAELNKVIFWSLVSYGVFFFPMGILALVMFDSVRGLNPVLLVSSIVSTFLSYCGLVVLFYGLGVLFIVGIMGSILSGIVGGAILSLVMTFVFMNLAFIWLLLIAGHLLGRFYWRYEEKLNWEV